MRLSAWIIDLVFFFILLVGLLFGAWRGFVKGVCKIAGTIFALFIAFSFCNPFKNCLENWFGLTSAISASGVGDVFAGWIVIAISFVALFLIVRLGAFLLGVIGKALAHSCKFFAGIDRFFGALLGLCEAFVLVYLLLTICYWIGVPSINVYLDASFVVGAIYRSDWFVWAATFQYFSLLP